MSTKKEIDNFVKDYFWDRLNSKSYSRKIYLTDKDYVEVKILRKYNILIIALYLDNSKTSTAYNCGIISDCDNIWRRVKKSFKGYIAQSEEFDCDKYVAKLKEIYSLL